MKTVNILEVYARMISDSQNFFPEDYQIVDEHHEEGTAYETSDWGMYQLVVNNSLHGCI